MEGEEEDEPDDDNAEEDVKKKGKKLSGKGKKRNARGKYSTKPQDFQIRIKVIEARQLQGGNISPVCKLTCWNQTKQTRVKKSTSSPFWNDTFFFNFNVAPADLLDELVSFSVFNSRFLRNDAMIGSFKFDIGMIYEEPGHCFMNKWLLLCDPDDPMAGAKGYLKICAVVLGPGDEAPSFKAVSEEEEGDIEDNLLRPAGVQLRPATFVLRLYRAEDLPKMDSDILGNITKIFVEQTQKKELVDPYVVVQFAGKEERSSIKYCNDHPEYNEELKIGLQFPSMCDRIKIQLFDWDRLTEDDPIGTYIINLSQISAQGETGDEGFLPSFGPCFINMYGSPREFSDLPDKFEALNLGKGDGVAYRGRLLLDLETILGESPEGSGAVGTVDQDGLMRVQKYLRRRKYRLHAAFLNACMITAISAPVEFEVSIGNYGNKLDEFVPLSASTTQPTNAVFDGTFYNFLPWANSKPCTVVESHWEDISFRLFTINFLLKIADRLEQNVNKIRIAMKANLPIEEQAQLVISAFDDLILHCNKELPSWEPGQSPRNTLDVNLYALRESGLKQIRKDALKIRDETTNVSNALTELEGFLGQIVGLANEPQNSMPDVVIWMISGEKRVAYFKIPAYSVFYSKNDDYRGRDCGTTQTINLKMPSLKEEEDQCFEIPAQLRMRIWLGQEKEENDWYSMQTEGRLTLVAETYENQTSLIGKWVTRGPLMIRPSWSDASGRIELIKETIQHPDNWAWDGDWYVSPELSLFYDKDAGHSQYLEDIYMNEVRVPGTPWGPSSTPSTNIQGDSCPNMENLQCPDGWVWTEDWQIDLNRPCDEEGWEYTVEASMGGYVPVEKTYHMCRRRRFVRPRKLIDESEAVNDEAENLLPQGEEHWEYAVLFDQKFHAKEQKMDMVRRRRWHRKLVPLKPGASCFFNLSTGGKAETTDGASTSEDEEPLITNRTLTQKSKMAPPRIFLTFPKPHKWQLRAYIYQARDLLAGDETGLSDPYARVAFLTQSQLTERIDKTLCPTWDQTLIFQSVEIHGAPESIRRNPPPVVVEIFDWDQLGEDDFLGRCEVLPLVKVNPDDRTPAILQWHQITLGRKQGGEILASFELFLLESKDPPFTPPRRGNLYIVPSGIRPLNQRTGIEVLTWGVRNMHKFQLSNVNSPSIEFEIGGHIIHSDMIKNASKNPNFTTPLLFFDVMLPREELYMPPMNIRVRDHRQFGRKPIVGLHVIKTMDEFRFPPLGEEHSTIEDYPMLRRTFGSTDGSSEDIRIDMSSDGEASTLSGLKILSDALAAEESGTGKKKKRSFFSFLKIGKKSKKKKKEGPSKPRMFNLNFFKTDDGEMIDLSLIDEDVDWWSKYYASLGEWGKCRKYREMGYDTLNIYNCELEKAENFAEFTDFCSTFTLTIGKNLDDDDEDDSGVGEFKGTFRVYPLPEDPSQPMPLKYLDKSVPCSDPVECIVRVYVIKAIDLQPNDPSGLADPYIEVCLGKKTVDNKDSYLPNCLCPEFGRMFEVKCTIPIQKDLEVRIKDYDLLSTDDVIGQTLIDLENRYLTKFRATCGVPQSYCTAGPTQWRDSLKPSQILTSWCETNRIQPPEWDSTNGVLRVGQRSFPQTDLEKGSKNPNPHLGPMDERMSLHVLNQLPVVKEHVETRPLYSPLQPGIEQGKLQMWVDIFPLTLGPPGPPFNIMPRKARPYVLRVIIWNTNDVILEDVSITGEKMSDIYVKGWLAGVDERQETDIHYRSLDGTGNFNWRFIFPFDYLPAENVMVVRQKEFFWSLDETELRLPCNLVIQIWDNDKFSADDFLGNLELNLSHMPAPAKTAKSCALTQLPAFGSDPQMINLFDCRRAKGFWPCYNDETGTAELTGKVEMELELLNIEDAAQKPSGLGRDEPNENPHLDEPKRPDTSFLWFTSPWKTFKYLIWNKFKWYFIGGIIILLVGLLLVLFIYNIPGLTARKMIGV